MIAHVRTRQKVDPRDTGEPIRPHSPTMAEIARAAADARDRGDRDRLLLYTQVFQRKLRAEQREARHGA